MGKHDKKEKSVGEKKLCELVKSDYLKDHTESYAELVRKPQYLCKKCGRSSASKKHVCKPVEL